MVTCVVVAHQRTQYESSKGKVHSLGRYGESPSSGSFREVNCRSFQSGAGLLPTPLQTSTCRSNSSAAVTRSLNSPYTGSDCSSEMHELLVASAQSTPIPIKTKSYWNGFLLSELSYCELWAGPTYSNSPPPSSVPIPKFSTRSKPARTVSLELPAIAREDVDIHPLAKSAPASPRESHLSAKDLFGSADNATKALRRILNLDICDE
uniref:Uncharacterized protein n=1 Tax=Kalanchoe fedtschenkoi TaxID=63787 RepID=A0A7N0ZRL1_KALFE